MPKINSLAPVFQAEAFHEGEIKKLSSENYKDKWKILMFYPADFTFVCPTELGEFADKYEEFKNLNTEVFSVSTDTAFVHKAWHDSSDTIKKIQYPMLADPTGKICKDFGTYIGEEGLSLRATFIIDSENLIKFYEIHDNSIGRNVNEILRKLKAAQYVSKNDGEVCPVNWEEGKDTLRPGLHLVGKL
ncbi:peroxiredoxin [Candidatus Pacearchaeota archaeon]|jgi:peroxiredoxin (alkyl hydroperoxide reductase subunit C)|nr:peroxiredoxin [Candidatus Pacearchaeota archaeon]|tara:strand:- start:35916 stop:36479 length:564 start_codon:yes stop_codon:yes gene_type:complete